MSADKEKLGPAAAAPKTDESAAREARLAQALRANLRRRKAAARASDDRDSKG